MKTGTPERQVDVCFMFPLSTPAEPSAIPTTSSITPANLKICPNTKDGPQHRLILKGAGKVLYDNIHHKLVPTVLDITGGQLPE